MSELSVQLAKYVKREQTTVGKNDTPAINVYYDRLDGEYAKQGQVVRYLVGRLGETSRAVIGALKEGDKFVVVKEKVANPKDSTKPFWNLVEFRSENTFVERPVADGNNKKSYEKKEYDNVGIKVGAARNQALAYLTANKGKYSLDDVDTLAYEIVKRQQAQEDNVRNGETVQKEVELANTQNDRDMHADDDVPF